MKLFCRDDNKQLIFHFYRNNFSISLFINLSFMLMNYKSWSKHIYFVFFSLCTFLHQRPHFICVSCFKSPKDLEAFLALLGFDNTESMLYKQLSRLKWKSLFIHNYLLDNWSKRYKQPIIILPRNY